MSSAGIDRDEAEELLLEAVDNIAEVQNEHGGLTDDMVDMLSDSKSGIAAVYMHLDGPVTLDLNRSVASDTEQSER